MTARRSGPLARIDQRLGRIWRRICGTVLLLMGLGAMVSVSGSEDFALATHWPGLAIASLFLLAAWGCFRSRAGLMDTLSDSHPDSRRE